MGFEIRADIAEALNNTPGVVGFERRPSTPKAGNAWPMRPSGEATGAVGVFETSWRVAVLLPQDEKAAERWCDDHLELLCEALQPVVYVDGWEIDAVENTPALILLCRE